MPALMMQPAVASEVGPRANNEDAAFASSRLLAVADGVGGAVAGELASTLAINKVVSLDKRRLDGSLERELEAVVADANAVIDFVTTYDPQLDGMGTTLTAVALSNEGGYLVANVGDSRSYLYRGGRLIRLTRDHTLVQALIDRGVLTEAGARRHPQRSVVLEALSGVERSLPPTRRIAGRCGDRLLLCSDGVTDYLTDPALAEALSARHPEEAAQEITRLALAQGARDNVTAVVADVVRRTRAQDGWQDYLEYEGTGPGFEPPPSG